MSKGHLQSLGIIGGIALVAAATFAACSDWEGVTLDSESSSLTTLYNSITQAGNESRMGWYDNQPGLDPAIVASANFKKLYDLALPITAGEQVYAQPLVWNNKVLVVTQANNIYLLDANSNTGAIVAQRSLRAAESPFDATAIGCGDITPTVGITGAPVIDNATNTAYFYAKSGGTGNATWKLHAIDLTSASLADRAGFPVTISGTAQNNTAIAFDTVEQHQRPGLLLMNGVIYAGFGAHCDINWNGHNYNGWIIGVSTAGQIVARWATMSSANPIHGSGVWMSGGGITSDKSGDLLFSTGNGPNQFAGQAYAGPTVGTSPPLDLEEAVVRLRVQGDKSLKAIDFFSPFNAGSLNGGDQDLGSGGVVSLTSQFGNGGTPNTAVVAGKGGKLYFLNRDALGGYQQGAGASDKALSVVDIGGATWSRAAAWPGDGGYVYVTVNGGVFNLQAFKVTTSGTAPVLAKVATAAENFGSFSGSPIVTSNGTTNGSAVVWVTRNTAELRAYRAVPAGGTLTSIFASAFGNQAKFTTVGIGNNRIFVGTGAGHVVAFGTTSSNPVSGGPLDFGKVTVNTTKGPSTLAITANQNLSITSITSSNGVFTLGTPTPGFNTALTAGQVTNLPVSFRPTAAGVVTAALTVNTTQGNGSLTVMGEGITTALGASPPAAAFGDVVNGQTKTLPITLTNNGSTTITFAASTAPTAPFSATGIPANGATLAANASTTVNVTFAPTTTNTYAQTLTINSNGGNVPIALTGKSGTVGKLVITPAPATPIDFGTIAAGTSATKSLTLANSGDLALQLTLSKPPAAPFSANPAPLEGATIAGHGSIAVTLTFAPTAAGTFSWNWELNEGAGLQVVTMNGTATGAATPLPRTGWIATATVASATDVPAKALDGSLATRFSTGAPQANGQQFQVDMGATNTISQIVMDSNGSADFAHGYQVFVSTDAANFGTAVATGTPTASPVTVAFTPKPGRYIRVVQTGTSTSWWSIHEFNAYGTAGGGGGGGGGAIKINSGNGGAVAPFVADTDFVGGGTISHANTIDLTGVTNPAPAAVYQTGRVGNFTYTIPGFTAGSSHLVRLHFCDTFFNTTGSRTFNVALNGTQVLTAFDIRAAAGAINKGVVREFTTNADSGGNYVIQFTSVVNQSLVSGIEIQ